LKIFPLFISENNYQNGRHAQKKRAIFRPEIFQTAFALNGKLNKKNIQEFLNFP
jgi:hypothetical protein